MTAFGAANTYDKNFYKSSSRLAEGNWVKVGVEKTGVYEISYETLMEMGFSDPSKVAVFGRGGRVLPEDFKTNAGVATFKDDLTEVKVIHEGGKLYFYGLGPDEIIFNNASEYDMGGYFTRKSNNIYSRRGYYFLTDSWAVTDMPSTNYDASSATKLKTGVSYLYHELDSVQNATQSGQLFWGESFNLPGLTRKHWEVSTPGATGKGVMQCVMYLQDGGFDGANVVYGFDGDLKPYPVTSNGDLYYTPFQPSVAEIKVPGDRGTITVGVDDAIDMREFANLDFWVVSYERIVEAGADAPQQLMAFPGLDRNKTYSLEIPDGASMVALDVTNDAEPQRLTLTSSGAGKFTAGIRTSTSKMPVVVIFDKEKPQLKISGYEKAYTQIKNQNLHAYGEKGADFIIITTPAFRPYAEQIADLHRRYDGIEVVVATTEECYNEFSGGTPDPMAYRSFAKMLYFTDRKPKNMLLLGPLYGDFRGLQSEHNPSEGIIAYQSPSISVSRGAHNINDFYGMMDDRFRTDYYERNPVNIGVAILPLKFESEARIVVEKIQKYLERDDHAYFLNKYTGIGGTGDEHTHDTQVRDIQNHIRSLDNGGTVFTPLAIDTYGYAEARKKFLNQLNEGCNMFSYFGHGAEQFLGLNRHFFNAGDVFSLRNQTLPLALFGGCQITNTDRGFRGLGETIVTATPYGCIGSVVSARDTWSGQNYEFFKQFFTCLFTEGSTSSSPQRSEPVTIGEVYAAVKHYSTYSNELAYQLLCDPALIIPTVNRSISLSGDGVELMPGDGCRFTGKVMKTDGTLDTDFNGQVVIRINEPEKTVGAGSIISGQDPNGLAYDYRDSQVTMATAEVHNGMFETEVHIPSSMASFEGENALLYFSVYDPSTKVGGAQEISAPVGKRKADSQEASDKTAPAIELLAFNEGDCSISLTVSDNLALNMSTSPLNKGLYLYIDGTERTEAHFAEPILEYGRAAFSKNVLLEGITYGEHTARLKVKDVAGNTSEQEILFTYNPRQAKYLISKDIDNSCAARTLIKFEGDVPANYNLMVISPSGTQMIVEGSGDSIELDHEGWEKGHYKVYILETGPGMQKGHSDPIDIQVI